MVSGHDVALAPGLRDRIDRELSFSQLLDWYEALESLLDSPTSDNPFVTDASTVQGYQLHDYVMVWRSLTITFRFLNALVVEVTEVRALPRLEPGEQQE